MKLAELSDDFTPEQFMQLDKEALDKLPYDIYKWNCCCKKCDNGTTIRDYGIHPFYFLNRNSKNASNNPRLYWSDLNQYRWFCGKHNKFFRRLNKKFLGKMVWEKLVDDGKTKIGELIKKVNSSTEKLNDFV